MYVYATTMNERKDCEFERAQEGVYGKDWKKKREVRNYVIML